MEKSTRRSSILKVRQQVDLCQEESDDGTTKVTKDRRVSFQNMKRVQQFDKDGGKFLHNSPLKEKITDTMDSDGILTPRGRTMEGPPTEDNNTFQIFDKHNSTRNTTVDMELEEDNTLTHGKPSGSHNDTRRTVVDMSIDAENTMDNTMNVFNVPHFVEKKTVVYERITKTTVVETETRCASKENMDDTMGIFNLTNREERDMEMETPQRNVSTSRVFDRNAMEDTAIIFNLNNTQSMEIDNDESTFVAPSMPNIPSERKLSPNGESMDDTMKVFNMTSRNVQDMDISGISEMNTPVRAQSVLTKVFDDCDGNQSMDMDMESVVATPTRIESMDNDTMAVFRSFRDENSRTEMEKKTVDRSEVTELIHDEKNSSCPPQDEDDMEMETMIDQTEGSPDEASNSEVKTHDEDKFDDVEKEKEDEQGIEMEKEKGDKEATLVLSPEVGEGTIVVIPNNDDITTNSRPNETINLVSDFPITNTSFGDRSDMVMEQTVDDVHQEENDATSELNSSQNRTVTSQIGTEENEENEAVETETTEDSFVENIELVEVYGALENSHLSVSKAVMEQEELNSSKNIVEMMQMDVSSCSSVARRSIVSHDHRAVQSLIESPRRIQEENSMIITENSVLRGCQGKLNDSVVNRSHNMSCASAISNKRDIFELNTSIRSSPRVSSILEPNSSINVMSPTISLPEFDMAVSNIVWLTKDNGLDEYFPEAELMKERIEKALITTEAEIEKTVNSGKVEKGKIIGIESGILSKLSSDEKDVVYVARRLAERQLLVMRMNFAREYSEQIKLETESIKLELDEKLKYIHDAEEYETLKNEVEQLRKQDFYTEARKLRREWQQMKLKAVDQLKEDIQKKIKAVSELVEVRKEAELQFKKSKKLLEEVMREENERKLEIQNSVDQIMRLRLFN